tara:strand:- start:1593 stop:2225 length:633 start_codon:yes stop_codon:yes gene_type:complete
MTILRSFTFYTIILSTILFYKLNAQTQPSKVLYAGVEIEGLESWMKEEFELKFNKIFEDITADQMIDDKNALDVAGEELDSLFSEINDFRFKQVADKMDVTYIFAGKFKNVSPDDRKVMIQGEFYRYNAQLNSSFRYDVLRYYERMDAEARVIKQQMVDSLPTVTTPSSFKNVLLLFGSILLVGILLMSLAGTDYNSTGDGSGGTPVTPA